MPTMTCPKCNYQTEENELFCSECGTKMVPLQKTNTNSVSNESIHDDNGHVTKQNRPPKAAPPMKQESQNISSQPDPRKDERETRSEGLGGTFKHSSLSAKVMLAVKVLILGVATYFAPMLMTITFFCFFGIGRAIAAETKRFLWIALAFVFMTLVGCGIFKLFPSIPCSYLDMIVIGAAWIIVFALPSDCSSPRNDK